MATHVLFQESSGHYKMRTIFNIALLIGYAVVLETKSRTWRYSVRGGGRLKCDGVWQEAGSKMTKISVTYKFHDTLLKPVVILGTYPGLTFVHFKSGIKLFPTFSCLPKSIFKMANLRKIRSFSAGYARDSSAKKLFLSFILNPSIVNKL